MKIRSRYNILRECTRGLRCAFSWYLRSIPSWWKLDSSRWNLFTT